MTAPIGPPDAAIAEAIARARTSPCVKSKRGVAVFQRRPDGRIWVISSAHNGPPEGFRCLREHCLRVAKPGLLTPNKKTTASTP